MKHSQIKQVIEKLNRIGVQAKAKTSTAYIPFQHISISLITAENGNFADYYQFSSPWISQELRSIADKIGCYWEWENSEEIILAY